MSGFVYRHKQSVMVSYLLLGFELELYHPREFRMVIWYLDFLLASSLGHQKATAQYVLDDEAYRVKGTKHGLNGFGTLLELTPRILAECLHIFSWQ